MSDWIVWVPSTLLAVGGVVLAVVVVRLGRRVDSLEGNATAVAEPAATPLVEEVAQQPSRNPASQAYVVTEVGPTGSGTPERHLEGSLFADLVLRESVVKAASYVHGVRRALAPETRNRIRFEMRQEVKRSRKQRRIDRKAARRHLADRHRARLDEDAA